MTAAGTEPPYAVPSLESVDQAEAEVRARYYDEVIGLFDFMLRYRRYRQRLQEFFPGSSGDLSVHGRVDLVIDGEERRSIIKRDITSNDHTVLVPFLWNVKGSFYNNLVVRDPSGSRLPMLSQAEVTALVSTTLGKSFALAFPVADDRAPSEPWTAGLNRLRQLVNVKDVVPEKSFTEEFDDIVSLVEEPPDMRRLDQLREYCKFFSGGYILAVQAPMTVGCHIGVDYSFATATPLNERTNFDDKIKDLFGLESRRKFMPLASGATLFQTYHLSAGVSVGTYDSEHAIFQNIDGRYRKIDPVGLEERAPGTRLEVRDTDTNADPHLFLRTSPTSKNLSNLGWEVTQGPGVVD